MMKNLWRTMIGKAAAGERTKNGRETGIEVSGLSWQPEQGSGYILNDVSCMFENGKIYGIIGPNGSGKTSLIRNILRFVEAEEGRITLDSLELKGYSRKELAREMALVPQNTNMETSFSAFDIVMMGRVPYQERFAENSDRDREIAEEAMRLTDCYAFRDKAVSMLSGGEAQRVVAARAIAQDTGWLILDEPTSSLDVRHQVEIMEALTKLNREKGRTIIAVLHDINMASQYCSNIVMMKNGRIHSVGEAGEVLTAENLADVYEINFDMIENPGTGRKYYIPYF